MVETPLIRRLVFTPLTDLLRFRLSGRLDWWGRIAASDLNADVKRTIRRVVGRTRLLSREKFDVAGDLIAHFQDAADANVSPANAIAELGELSTQRPEVGGGLGETQWRAVGVRRSPAALLHR